MLTFPSMTNARAQLRSGVVMVAAASVLLLLAGCGGQGSGMTSGSSSSSGAHGTPIVLMASSTANDRIPQLQIQITGLNLISDSGTSVPLVTSPLYPEMIHLNGVREPLAAGNIPPGTYTSAAVTLGSALFVCTSYEAGSGLQTSTFVYGQVPASSIHISVPAPIKVTSAPTAFLLSLDVSSSASFTSCQGGTATNFSITPTMTLTPAALGNASSTSNDALVTGMQGLVTSIRSADNSFTVDGADGTALFGPTWQILTDSNTEFQGIGSLAQLGQGMPVDIDVNPQSDGSLLATRVSVFDLNTTDLNVFTGPMNFVSAVNPTFSLIGQQQQGYLDSNSYFSGAELIDDRNASFQIAGPPSRFSGLPFQAVFSASTAVAGQNVSVTSQVPLFLAGALPASTVTLMPQSLNGTVRAISRSGDYITYVLKLATYDTFPNLANQPGESLAIANPGTVVIYAGVNTRMLTANPIAVGSVYRFYGQVFNDQGVLRMVCLQVNDGVAL
jgi:hypothetical protein